MFTRCDFVRVTISFTFLTILCSPFLFFGLANFTAGSNRNGPFPDFDWDGARDIRDELTDASQWRGNLQRLLALVNVTAVPFALTSPSLVQTLKADARAAGAQKANEYSPRMWRSVHVTERGRDVVFVCGLPCSSGLESDLVRWSFKLNNASEETWGSVPNEYPRFFTVKFKDCGGLSVLVIHHVSDAEGGAMFKCHYRKKNDKPMETIIESVVELVLLDGARGAVEPSVEMSSNATLDEPDILFSDGPANETDYVQKEEKNRTLLFADFQQPSESDMPKLLRLLNVSASLTAAHDPRLEETRSESPVKVTSNVSESSNKAVLRHSLQAGDRLLLQCANTSAESQPDVRWFVANGTVHSLETTAQPFEFNGTHRIDWVPIQDDFPRQFLITLKNSGGNRLLVLLENKKPALYKCSYKKGNEQTNEVIVYLTLSNKTEEKASRVTHVAVENKDRLSARNETKVTPAVTSRKGEQVLINVLSWAQNTLDFYVELLRVKGNQLKRSSAKSVPQNTSEVLSTRAKSLSEQ